MLFKGTPTLTVLFFCLLLIGEFIIYHILLKNSMNNRLEMNIYFLEKYIDLEIGAWIECWNEMVSYVITICWLYFVRY